MNKNGGNVIQVTHLEGVVDHDPLGGLNSIIFERLMTATDYATDITSLFTPWNIVEVQLDNGNECTLVADVWVNWLPVYDPTRNYIMYLKSPGYTEARLITRTGEDLGRLIPNITSLSYIDWE